MLFHSKGVTSDIAKTFVKRIGLQILPKNRWKGFLYRLFYKRDVAQTRVNT
jgi:hypothetical protein